MSVHVEASMTSLDNDNGPSIRQVLIMSVHVEASLTSLYKDNDLSDRF